MSKVPVVWLRRLGRLFLVKPASCRGTNGFSIIAEKPLLSFEIAPPTHGISFFKIGLAYSEPGSKM
jgi:hypothetical protein